MKTAFTILTFLLAGNLLGQEAVRMVQSAPAMRNDVSILKQAFAITPKVRISEQHTLSKKNTNELQWVLSGLFLAYKSFFSSQDYQSCSFHPSCSEFGLEAVKKLGVIRGLMCTCDRLTRCNGFSPDQYEIDMERRILKDPVKW
jgi:putative component of membrane protein insertase Oxa1/YidC/SpoIIIJ protein YidD